MQEKRKEPRVQESADVTVEVVSAPDIPGIEGRIFNSNSVDISVNGMQLFIELPIPVGSELKLEIIFGHDSGCFQHTGIVMWDRELNKDATDIWLHTIGIHFRMDERLKIIAWAEAVQQLYKFYETS